MYAAKNLQRPISSTLNCFVRFRLSHTAPPSQQDATSSRTEGSNAEGSEPLEHSPDLSYLMKSNPKLFASQLAAMQMGTTSTSQNATAEERTRRIERFALQRKAERLARVSYQYIETAEQKSHRMKKLAEQRKAERLAREAGPTRQNTETVEQRTQRIAKLTENRRAERLARDAAQITARRRVEAELSRSSSVPSKKRERKNIRVTNSSSSNEQGNFEDISLETLENGGDMKIPAEITTPELPFTNLDKLFNIPSSKQKTAIKPSSKLRAKGLREVYGVDYAPRQGRGNAIVEPFRLGPLRHAQAVMSKRKDISIESRMQAMAIITSTERATTSRALQTSAM